MSTSKFEAPAVVGQNRIVRFGYPYWLVIDYADSKLVWCKVSRGTGEAGSSGVLSRPRTLPRPGWPR